MNFLGPGGHDGARGRVGPMVRVGMGVRGVMSRKRGAAGPGAGGGGVSGVAGGPRGGVAVGRLAHLRARAQVAVAALHLAGGQGAAGRLEAGGGGRRGLVQIRVVHDGGYLPLNVLLPAITLGYFTSHGPG